MQFLPDGRLLVTERPGTMRIVGKDGKLSEPIAGVPEVAAVGQGGLLDVLLAPDFATVPHHLFHLRGAARRRQERHDGGARQARAWRATRAGWRT